LPKFNVLLEPFMGFFSELCEKLFGTLSTGSVSQGLGYLTIVHVLYQTID